MSDEHTRGRILRSSLFSNNVALHDIGSLLFNGWGDYMRAFPQPVNRRALKATFWRHLQKWLLQNMAPDSTVWCLRMNHRVCNLQFISCGHDLTSDAGWIFVDFIVCRWVLKNLLAQMQTRILHWALNTPMNVVTILTKPNATRYSRLASLREHLVLQRLQVRMCVCRQRKF